MKKKPFFRLLLPLIFLMAAVIAVPLSPQEATGKSPKVHTPAPGSPERRAILDAMRLKVKELHALDVLFVVRSMRVSEGWAWVYTLPRSTDGRELYEAFYALLHRERGGWYIAEIPCTEPDNPECLDTPGYFMRLAERFPGLPSVILPGGNAKP